MSESSEKAKLFLLIQGNYYLCERMIFQARENANVVGWKLTKMNDKLAHSPYCVIRQPSGRMTCECADFLMGRTSQSACKHIDACVDIFGPSLRGI